MLGISVGTLRNWEQGRRAPEGLALAGTDGTVAWGECLPGVVVFPNVSERDLRPALGERLDLAGKERLAPDAFPRWLAERLPPNAADGCYAVTVEWDAEGE